MKISFGLTFWAFDDVYRWVGRRGTGTIVTCSTGTTEHAVTEFLPCALCLCLCLCLSLLIFPSLLSRPTSSLPSLPFPSLSPYISPCPDSCPILCCRLCYNGTSLAVWGEIRFQISRIRRHEQFCWYFM